MDKCLACCDGGFLEGIQTCVYCNGTKQYNRMAEAYIKNHICQCIINDRENCPVCKKKCHHDTSLNPKQKIDGGFGGISEKPKYNEDEIITI